MPFPSIDGITFDLLHDTNTGPYLGSADRPSNYQGNPSYLVQTNPYEFVIDWYEQYSDTYNDPLAFPTDALCNVYITFADSAVARTLLVAGEAIETVTIEETDYYIRTRFKIPNDTFPPAFVSRNRVRLVFEVTDASGNEIATAFLDTYLVDANGVAGDDADITSKYMTVSTETLIAATTLTAYPGFIRYLADASAAVVPITLPDPAAYTGQWIEVIAVDVTNAVTVLVPSGTYRGVTDTSVQFTTVDDASQFVSDGTYWYHINPWGRLE